MDGSWPADSSLDQYHGFLPFAHVRKLIGKNGPLCCPGKNS
jgi:hypothetical protein